MSIIGVVAYVMSLIVAISIYWTDKDEAEEGFTHNKPCKLAWATFLVFNTVYPAVWIWLVQAATMPTRAFYEFFCSWAGFWLACALLEQSWQLRNYFARRAWDGKWGKWYPAASVFFAILSIVVAFPVALLLIDAVQARLSGQQQSSIFVPAFLAEVVSLIILVLLKGGAILNASEDR